MLKSCIVQYSVSFVIHITSYGKVADFLKNCGTTKMVMRRKISKFPLVALKSEGPIHMSI